MTVTLCTEFRARFCVSKRQEPASGSIAMTRPRSPTHRLARTEKRPTFAPASIITAPAAGRRKSYAPRYQTSRSAFIDVPKRHEEARLFVADRILEAGHSIADGGSAARVRLEDRETPSFPDRGREEDVGAPQQRGFRLVRDSPEEGGAIRRASFE